MNKFYLLILAFANFVAAKYDSLPVCRKNDTAFVFDLHGVVLEMKKGKAIKGFLKNKNKGKFLKKLSKRKSGRSIEEAFIKKDGTVSEDDIRTLNPFVLNKNTVEIIKSLRRKGFAVFLCSNIGIQSFEVLKKEYPEVFGKSGLFCDCWVSSPANGYISKNSPKAFSLCKDMVLNWASNNNKSFRNIVMIDDSSHKLQAAEQVGFKCYKFKKAKKLNCAISQALAI